MLQNLTWLLGSNGPFTCREEILVSYPEFPTKLEALTSTSKHLRVVAAILFLTCAASFAAAQDAVRINPQSPPPNTPLVRGGPVQFRLSVEYTLESANSAIMSISVAQIPSSAGGCEQNGGGGELVTAVDVPIWRGRHTLETSVTWPGDTGVDTNGRVVGSGWVAFVPMFWADVNGHRGARFRMFPRVWCYSFGEGRPREPEFPGKGFFGSWLNNDPQTRDITRIVVSRRGNDIEVRAWGACHPQDCDWGLTRGDLAGNVLRAYWNDHAAQRNMVLVRSGQGLNMTLVSDMQSGARRETKQYFLRQP